MSGTTSRKVAPATVTEHSLMGMSAPSCSSLGLLAAGAAAAAAATVAATAAAVGPPAPALPPLGAWAPPLLPVVVAAPGCAAVAAAACPALLLLRGGRRSRRRGGGAAPGKWHHQVLRAPGRQCCCTAGVQAILPVSKCANLQERSRLHEVEVERAPQAQQLFSPRPPAASVASPIVCQRPATRLAAARTAQAGPARKLRALPATARAAPWACPDQVGGRQTAAARPPAQRQRRSRPARPTRARAATPATGRRQSLALAVANHSALSDIAGRT